MRNGPTIPLNSMDSAIDITELPPDLLASSQTIGARNAEDVAGSLQAFGIGRASGDCSTTVSLPRELMLGLALVAELNRWERNRITIHMDAGLPSSELFLREVMRLLQRPELIALVVCLSRKVAALSCRNFIWSAQAEHRIDLAVVVTNDDDPLDLIADFLWAHRHTPIIPGRKDE